MVRNEAEGEDRTVQISRVGFQVSMRGLQFWFSIK
jgi:hypothetical protein